jgi:dolichyl-phosphate beta-glucosyltransferase
MVNSGLHLSVVIPAYNEERRILKTLERVAAYLQEQEYGSEVIVVDDGSRDRTVDVVASFQVRHPVRLLRNEVNRGKGYSVRRGVMNARGRYILFSDADLSTPIEELEKFWPEFEGGADVVIGSRALPESEILVHQPRYRELMGRVFNICVQAVALPGLRDTQCGFKAFTQKAARIVFSRQSIEGWGFDAEILFIARLHGLTIREVPVRWLNSEESKINSLSDSVRMFRELLSIRWKNRKGLYT